MSERARKRRSSKVAFSEEGGWQRSSLSSLDGSEQRSLSSLDGSEGTNPSTQSNLFPIRYAFSLFLRKFHFVNPVNGNFCDPGRACSTSQK